jgi:hypothetical protein
MSDSSSFAKFVPGFDFLQGLASSAVKGAASSIPQLPAMGDWVAPTLSVEDLEKRIAELQAVQFWLDQNAKALAATITALEVQKMTLATLKSMNFSMGDVANAFKLKAADTVMGGVQKAADTAKGLAGFGASPSPSASAKKPAAKKTGKAAASSAGGVIDPMQWWGSLTKQFTDIAAGAMKDAAQKTAMDSTKNMAANITKDAVKMATKTAMKTAQKTADTISSFANKSVATKDRSTLTSRKKLKK